MPQRFYIKDGVIIDSHDTSITYTTLQQACDELNWFYAELENQYEHEAGEDL